MESMIVGLFIGIAAWTSLGVMAAIAVGRASAIGTCAERCEAALRRRR
jgi:hypothetical protein